MVQPKYSPEEALQRIKLMMEYDSSKTLTENKKLISEQSVNTAGMTALSSGAGAAIAASIGTGAALGTAIPIPVVGTAIGALAGLGLGILTTWYANKDKGKDAFVKLMEVCNAPGVNKLVKKMSNSEIRNIVHDIEDAKSEWNDNEEAIESALRKIETIADLCAVDKKVTGGLVEFLNGITDDPKEWKMFTRPIEGMIEDTEIILTPEEQKKTNTDGKTVGNTGGKTAKIPTELGDINGVKKFQDWLDTNKPGWASGYKDGKIEQGKNGGGYGRFGPRTSKAWSSYGQEYIKGGTTPDKPVVVTPGEQGVEDVNNV